MTQIQETINKRNENSKEAKKAPGSRKEALNREAKVKHFAEAALVTLVEESNRLVRLLTENGT